MYAGRPPAAGWTAIPWRAEVIALDANVLVRFLVRDDEGQARRARALIEASASAGDACLITSPVLCELEWVLEGV